MRMAEIISNIIMDLKPSGHNRLDAINQYIDDIEQRIEYRRKKRENYDDLVDIYLTLNWVKKEIKSSKEIKEELK